MNAAAPSPQASAAPLDPSLMKTASGALVPNRLEEVITTCPEPLLHLYRRRVACQPRSTDRSPVLQRCASALVFSFPLLGNVLHEPAEAKAEVQRDDAHHDHQNRESSGVCEGSRSVRCGSTRTRGCPSLARRCKGRWSVHFIVGAVFVIARIQLVLPVTPRTQESKNYPCAHTHRGVACHGCDWVGCGSAVGPP